MKKVVVFYMTLAVCALVMQVSARPATASFQTVSNKDGSSVSIRYFGDEHYHYVETSDGYLVMLDSEGNFVYVGEDGRASKVVAKNVADRTEDEKAFLNGLDQEAVRENHEKLHGGRFPEDSSIKADSQAQNVSASQTALAMISTNRLMALMASSLPGMG